MSALCQAEITDYSGTPRRLNRTEVAMFGNLLFSAGTDGGPGCSGTRQSCSLSMPRSGLHSRLSPSSPATQLRSLRHQAPSPVQGRWTTRPVHLHGVTIPEDAKVLLLTGSAGRDERAFPDPDRFDVRRQHAASRVVRVRDPLRRRRWCAARGMEGRSRPRNSGVSRLEVDAMMSSGNTPARCAGTP